MTQRRSRHCRRRLGVIVPLASMGDIAFLLIIFFIIASNFTKEPAVDLDPATSALAIPLDQARVLVVIDAQQRLWVNGERRASADAVEADLLALLDGREGQTERLVYLKVDRRVPQPVYEPVIAAIAEAGGTLAAVGQKEEQP